jgi:hypothetical protein
VVAFATMRVTDVSWGGPHERFVHCTDPHVIAGSAAAVPTTIHATEPVSCTPDLAVGDTLLLRMTAADIGTKEYRTDECMDDLAVMGGYARHFGVPLSLLPDLLTLDADRSTLRFLRHGERRR